MSNSKKHLNSQLTTSHSTHALCQYCEVLRHKRVNVTMRF